MKYKILKGTALFEKFIELHKNMQLCHDKAKELVKELDHGDTYYPESNRIAGGIMAFIIKTGKPPGWANAFIPHVKNAYMPRKTKANAALLERIKKLPVVSNDDFNKIINYDWRKACKKDDQNSMGRRTISFSPGFDIKDEYVLIDISQHAPYYEPVEDMIEITVSEFNKLTASNASI